MQLIIYNLPVEDSNWSPQFGEAEAKKLMHPKMARNKRVLTSKEWVKHLTVEIRGSSKLRVEN